MNQWLVDEDDKLMDCDHELLLECYNEDMEEGDCVINNTSDEWSYFLNFVRDHMDLKPYRTEWMIYDEKVKLAGSVDMVYKNPDGTIDIYDWKRAKEISAVNNFRERGLSPALSHITHSNFWHYSLQLNVYKTIIERNYGLKVRNLFLVQLHPDSEVNNYKLYPCADLSKEVDDMFEFITKNVK